MQMLHLQMRMRMRMRMLMRMKPQHLGAARVPGAAVRVRAWRQCKAARDPGEVRTQWALHTRLKRRRSCCERPNSQRSTSVFGIPKTPTKPCGLLCEQTLAQRRLWE
jgi:hypothetical protein